MIRALRRLAAACALAALAAAPGCGGTPRPAPAGARAAGGPAVPYADATAEGRTEQEARRAAIRAGIAELRGHFVESSTEVRDDRLVEDRVRVFAAQGNVVTKTLATERNADGSVRVTVRVWLGPPGPGAQPAEGTPAAAPAQAAAPATATPSPVGAQSVADALDAEAENAREASTTLADLVRDAARASLAVQAFHADGRALDLDMLATRDLVPDAGGTLALRVVVRVGAGGGARADRARRFLRDALEASSASVIRNATELVASNVFSGSPLLGEPVRRGQASVHGLRRPGPGQRSVLLAVPPADASGHSNWIRFDQYLVASDLLPDSVVVPAAAVVSVVDAAGATIASERIALAPARYLIRWDRITGPSTPRDSSPPVEIGDGQARAVTFPFLGWGPHVERGQRGEHLAVHSVALTAGTLAGGGTAYADGLEFLAVLQIGRNDLPRARGVTVAIESGPLALPR